MKRRRRILTDFGQEVVKAIVVIVGAVGCLWLLTL